MGQSGKMKSTVGKVFYAKAAAHHTSSSEGEAFSEGEAVSEA